MADALARLLKGRSDADAKALFMGWLTRSLPGNARAVLVGGALVELYTQGAIASADVDIVGDRAAITATLLKAGFVARSRYLERPDLGLLVEIPNETLRPTETTEVVHFAGHSFLAVSVEDAIVDRLLAAKFWRSRTDWERAVVLARVQAERVDWGELLRRAEANDAADIARELQALVS